MQEENHLQDISSQTEEEDAVDSSMVVSNVNGHFDYGLFVGPYSSCSNAGPLGFLSTIASRCFPWTSEESLIYTFKNFHRRNVSTQTEERDPIAAQGQLLSYLLLKELVLNQKAPYTARDDIYESLTSYVKEMLFKHSILFQGMINRVIETTHYNMFESVANELFEANSNNEREELRITWGRILSLFAFSVRLAQEYGHNPQRVNEISRFLALYVSKYVIPFVKRNGGWTGLVEEFPPPVDLEKGFRRVMMWSGLCVGAVASVYVASSLFRSGKLSN